MMDTMKEEITGDPIDQSKSSFNIGSNSSLLPHCGKRQDDGDCSIQRKRIRIEDQKHNDTSQLDESSMKQHAEDCSTDIDISRMCCPDQPVESTRMSTETSNSESMSQSYLDRSCFKTVICDDDTECDVSILSRVVNLIFAISFDLKTILGGGAISKNVDSEEEIVLRVLCKMKTVRDLTSTLCSVHEAVGLKDLKILSHVFKDEVKEVWNCIKKLTVQNKNDTNNDKLKDKMFRLLELAGAFSLAAVDHIIRGEGRLYVAEQFEGELSVHFTKHQNRFLTTMLDEVSATVSKGIEDMKKYQLSSDHEMSEDLVDSVMNVLTSMATLFQQCENLLLVYLHSVQQCSGRFYADECFHLRNILTDIIDYNDNISLMVEKSKLIAKNCDALDQFLDVPVVLADITKSICSSLGDLVAYSTSRKELDELIVDALYESLERFVFSGKTVRVGVSMLVQEVEKDLNVAEDCSIVQLVQNDASMSKRGSLCPMNTSQFGVDLLLKEGKSKYKDRRSSHALSEQYVSRYMDLSSVNEN